MCRVLLLEPDVTLGRALAAWLPVLGFEVVEPVVWEGPGSALDRARPGLVVIVVGGAAEMGLAIAEAVRRRVARPDRPGVRRVDDRPPGPGRPTGGRRPGEAVRPPGPCGRAGRRLPGRPARPGPGRAILTEPFQCPTAEREPLSGFPTTVGAVAAGSPGAAFVSPARFLARGPPRSPTGPAARCSPRSSGLGPEIPGPP